MSVDIGTAEGHIILDTSGFVVPLQTAQRDIHNFASDIAVKIGGAMQTLGNTIANIGNTITKYISAPLQDFAKSAFSEMAEFEDGMNRAGAIAKSSAEELAALTEKAKEMGRTTKFSATEATKALQYMGMAGWDSQQMMDGLEGIMNLAAASGEDLASVSDIVTDALTAMGLKASDSAHFADVLTAATLNSNTTVGMLGEAFKYAAPVAGALNYKIEDLTLALGLMANAGIKGAQAGTSLRTSLTRMSIAPGQVALEMEKFGISMYNADRTAKPLSQLMAEIREKFRGLDEQTKITAEGIIFGGRAMTAWGAIIEASEEDFNRLQTVLRNAEGTARKTAEKMLESFAGRLTLLQSAISGFKLQFTQDVLPFLTDIVNKIIDFISKISNLESGTRKAVLAFVAFGAAIGPLVASFGGVVALLGGVVVSVGFLVSSIGTLSAAVGISAAAFTGWGAAILAGIAAIGGVIATFIAAFIDLMANNEEFYNDFMSIINDIRKTLSEFKAEITGTFEEMGAGNLSFTEALSMAWIAVKNLIAPILLWLAESVRNTINYITSIAKGFTEILNGIALIFQGNFKEGLSKFFTGIGDLIVGFFDGLIQMAISQVKAIVGIFQSIGKSKEEIAKKSAEVDDIFTESAKKREEYKNKAIKSEKEQTKETEAELAKRLLGYEKSFAQMGINLEKEDAEVQKALEAQGEKHVGNFDAAMKQLPGIIADQREPMRVEADKIGTDLIDEGDIAGAGYIGIMDAHLSHLEGIFNDYLSDALDVVDDFSASFQESGKNSAEAFSGAMIAELQKLPGSFTTQLNAVLATTKDWVANMAKEAAKLPGSFTTQLNSVLTITKTWSANMAKEAASMASTFNTNAAKTASDLSTKLNNNLNASLNTASSWTTKMGKKGAEGAKLFLDYMLSAVDSQGAEIERFGKEIAEHLTVGIQNHSDWIKDRLKSTYYKIIDDMEEDMGLSDRRSDSVAAKAASFAYAGDYSLGYGTIAGTTAQRATSAAAAQTTTSTINFYSPRAIDEIEASRLLRKTQQDMLLGF